MICFRRSVIVTVIIPHFQDDDNEENNLIPFADVPHGEQNSGSGQEPETIPDREITVINLQKDKSKQNFKGFVDTELIDDNLRQVDDSEAPPPVVSPAPFIPTPLVSETPSSTAPSTFASFVPTSLPSSLPNTETLNVEPLITKPLNTELFNTETAPETVQPTEDDTSPPTGKYCFFLM